MNYNVYIGYDESEKIAADVCKFSILQRTDQLCPPDVHFLKSQDIPEFVRPREPNQSTDFTYTRFMVPFLNDYEGFSVFCDCDFLFQADILDLVLSVDPKKAVSVVKHPSYNTRTDIKMDGIAQHNMPRKNWASLIVFNNAHPSNMRLTPYYINTCNPGRSLHQFSWLSDDEIGSIPLNWNTLDDYYHLDNPKAIHYTDGGPWFKDYQQTMYSHRWWKEYYDYTDISGQQRTLSPNT